METKTMIKDYGYLNEEQAKTVQAEATTNALFYGERIWGFLHSTMMEMIEKQGAKYKSGADGYYRLSEFDVNSAASYLEIALDARDEALRDRAENDKSG
jgi:hypothetical protein